MTFSEKKITRPCSRKKCTPIDNFFYCTRITFFFFFFYSAGPLPDDPCLALHALHATSTHFSGAPLQGEPKESYPQNPPIKLHPLRRVDPEVICMCTGSVHTMAPARASVVGVVGAIRRCIATFMSRGAVALWLSVQHRGTEGKTL